LNQFGSGEKGIALPIGPASLSLLSAVGSHVGFLSVRDGAWLIPLMF
jgi:hypothetical protein